MVMNPPRVEVVNELDKEEGRCIELSYQEKGSNLLTSLKLHLRANVDGAFFQVNYLALK